MDKVVKSENKKNISTLGEIIHNKQVINHFSRQNVNIVKKEDLDTLKDSEDILIVRAHGIPRDVEDVLISNSIEYIDATCGRVKVIHKK